MELILLSLRRFLPSIFHSETDQWIGEIYIGDEYLSRPFSSSLLHFISIHVIGAHRLSGNSPSGALDFEALLNFKEVSQISTIFAPQRCHYTDSLNFKAQELSIWNEEGTKGPSRSCGIFLQLDSRVGSALFSQVKGRQRATYKHIIDSLFKSETLVFGGNGSIHYLWDKLPLASAGVMACSNTTYQNRFASVCARSCICVCVSALTCVCSCVCVGEFYFFLCFIYVVLPFIPLQFCVCQFLITCRLGRWFRRAAEPSVNQRIKQSC